MRQDENRDRSIRNAPGGQQMVLGGQHERWIVVLALIAFGSMLLAMLAWNSATRAAERAFNSQQSAALAREYAVQVFPQLNRLGYPVISPGEPNHPTAQPEDYAKLDAYIEQRKKEKQP